MKDPFPFWTIGGIFIGLLTLPIVIGVFILAFSIYCLCKYFKENKRDKFGLHIVMSSGFCMIIGSEDYAFLHNVQNVISSNFVENNDLPAIINIENKNINIDKNAGIVSTGENAQNSFNK